MMGLAEWDLKVFEAFNGLAGKNKRFDRLVVFFARYYTVLMPVGVLLYLQFNRGPLSFRHLVFSQLAALFAARGIVTELIRLFYRRKRPFLAHRVKQLIKKYSEASFPSGHTISIMAMGIVLAHFEPGLGWFVVSSGLVVGLARIVAGVHYPLDVLAGIILSWPSAVLGLSIYHYFIK